MNQLFFSLNGRPCWKANTDPVSRLETNFALRPDLWNFQTVFFLRPRLLFQISEAVDVDVTPPWWLQCNPNRFPYWSVHDEYWLTKTVKKILNKLDPNGGLLAVNGLFKVSKTAGLASLTLETKTWWLLSGRLENFLQLKTTYRCLHAVILGFLVFQKNKEVDEIRRKLILLPSLLEGQNLSRHHHPSIHHNSFFVKHILYHRLHHIFYHHLLSSSIPLPFFVKHIF